MRVCACLYEGVRVCMRVLKRFSYNIIQYKQYPQAYRTTIWHNTKQDTKYDATRQQPRIQCNRLATTQPI